MLTRIVFVIGLSILSIALGFFVRDSARSTFLPLIMNLWTRPVVISAVFFVVLLLYPERIRESTIGALFTVVVAAVLLFMPVWAWGEFWIQTIPASSKTMTPRWIWVVIGLIAVLVGLTIGLRELTAEGETISFAGSIFIISIYVGLELAGVLIGYIFLGKFLGIFQKSLVK